MVAKNLLRTMYFCPDYHLCKETVHESRKTLVLRKNISSITKKYRVHQKFMSRSKDQVVLIIDNSYRVSRKFYRVNRNFYFITDRTPRDVAKQRLFG